MAAEVGDDIMFDVRMLDPASHETLDSDLLREIGQLRFNVWKHENSINEELFPDKCWVDSLDCKAYHWVATDRKSGAIIASSRLTLHSSLDDDYRDVQLWKRAKKHLPMPTTDLGRLIVHPDYRGRGIAQILNQLRVEYAKILGAKSVMVTGISILLACNFTTR